MIKKYLFFSFLIISVLLPGPVSAAPPVREVHVAVAVAPSFKSLHNWKSEFDRRLGYASKIFENQFKVKFRTVAVTDWNLPDETIPIADLCEDLRSRFPLNNLDGVDVVIGLTRLTEIPPNLPMQDLHAIGQARPFSGYLVLRYPMNKLFKIQEETVLVHEMGHLFGAVHTMDRNSIMAPVVERQIPNRFDADNEQIILQTRSMDFRQGVAVLQGPTLQILLNSYMKLIQTEQSADFFYALGIFYLQLGATENTVKAWTKALEIEDNVNVRYDLGILQYKLGNQAQAVKELSKAVAGFHFPSLKDKEASALAILGKAYMAQGNLLAAWTSLKRASSILPGDMEIQTNLAIVEVKRGNYQEGLQLLLRASKRDPNNFNVIHGIGLAYFHMEKYDEAIGHFNKALQLIGSKGAEAMEIYAYLGNSYIKMGKNNEALQFLSKACQMDPSIACHKKLGLISFQLGLWDNVIQELGGIVQQDKSDPDAYGALGVALAQKKDHQNAVAIFREGIQNTKDTKIQAKFHSNIGQIMIGQRMYEPAEQEFQAAITKDWTNMDAHFGLGMVYMAKNDFLNAKEALQHVTQLDPRNARARQMLTNVEAALRAEAAKKP